MLQTQINYLTLRETVRHNLQSEAVAWANYVLEKLKLEETKRHNLAMEQIQLKQLAETIRHNVVSENQKDVELGIQQFLADTKYGELLVKQGDLELKRYTETIKLKIQQGELDLKRLTEPIKAQASLLSGQGAVMRGSAALQESQYAGTKAKAQTTQAKASQSKAKTEAEKAKWQKEQGERGLNIKESQGSRDLDIKQQHEDSYRQQQIGNFIKGTSLQSIEPVPGAPIITGGAPGSGAYTRDTVPRLPGK